MKSFLLFCFGLFYLFDCVLSGSIILFRNESSSIYYNYGIVRVYNDGEWGNICDDDDYDQYEADVICHQLGYTGASSFSRAGLVNYGSDNASIEISNLNCSSSSYLTIYQCSYSAFVDSGCINNDAYDATVYCYTTRIWNSNPYNGMIRLQGGNYSNQGRVEVYCNGQWGTICDDGFGSTDANTICKQLGYTGYLQYDHLALPGSSGQPIWSTYMSSSSSDSCFGTSNSCPSTSVTSCSHSEDITITCTTSNFTKNIYSTTSSCVGLIRDLDYSGNGAIRLYRNGVTLSSYFYGIVQIKINDEWGNICDDDDYDQYEADVICHQLGYTGASSNSRAGLVSYGTDNNSMILDDVSCPHNSYLTILQCSYSTVIDSGCTNYYDATVHCYSTRIWDSNPYNGMIRLQGGNFSNQGRVEVYCNGQWGTICDNGFGSADANTICRQLGYTGYIFFDHLTLPGSSGQPIWSTYMSSSSNDSCFGTSNSCPSTSVTSCSHSEDITITCTTSNFNKNTYSTTSSCVGLIRDLDYSGNGAIRLYRNGVTLSSYFYGIVQIKLDGEWGNICDDSYYDQYEADVICHQLGYNGASSYSRAELVSYGTDNNSMILDDVNCPHNSYLTILQCSYSTVIDSGCTNSYDATVHCYSTRIWDSNPYNGMIRLQGGNYSNEGRVEVYCNGQWGTICDNLFSSTDARIICKQLGYNSYSNFSHLNLPGASSKPVWALGMQSRYSDTCFGTSNSCPSNEYVCNDRNNDVTIHCKYDTDLPKPTTNLTTCFNNTESALDILLDFVTSSLFYVLVSCVVGVILLCCCVGCCYAGYKNDCSCKNPSKFCCDCMKGPCFCCVYIAESAICPEEQEIREIKRKARKRREIREMEEMEHEERRRELQAMRETQLISQLKNAGPSDSKIVVLRMDN